MKLTRIFIFILIVAGIAEAATVKSTRKLLLGETEINVNIYENTGANITFFAPHYNEQLARTLAREYIEKNGGRFVEIESLDERGKASRYLKFKFSNKNYSVDPNRIYTENGRNCNVGTEINAVVKNFADNLLPILFAPDGKNLRENERFFVAVHNNTDVSAKEEKSQMSDLTAAAFLKSQSTKNIAHGAFEAQADGVFLSNTETDEDNFIFLSTPQYIGHFAEKGFNVVVQKSANKLQSKQCNIDDGSLSVYSAQTSIPYICLEADGLSGTFRQRQMFEAVYDLLPKTVPNLIADKK